MMFTSKSAAKASAFLSVVGAFATQAVFANGATRYFVADHVAVVATDASDPARTQTEISYDLPCWAQFVSTVQTRELQNPLTPEGSFTSVVGVILKETDASHSCEGGAPAPAREHLATETNTNAPEGIFLGFQALTPFLKR